MRLDVLLKELSAESFSHLACHAANGELARVVAFNLQVTAPGNIDLQLHWSDAEPWVWISRLNGDLVQGESIVELGRLDDLCPASRCTLLIWRVAQLQSSIRATTRRVERVLATLTPSTTMADS